MDEVTMKRVGRIVAGTLAGAGVAAWFLTSAQGAGARRGMRKLADQTKDLGHETVERTLDLIALGKEITHEEDWKEAIETLETEPETGSSPEESSDSAEAQDKPGDKPE
ncbi:hypothetical protein QWJ34_06500 [Saccharibacillus sp. CPCC 101409]|uniref:hypothetical protein n=1 Tax=Saccharibacillus sp. CPCC 101409 TaxID=3058041 RepID=UPI0026739346|nr:hypothetical protein [Saccharibacillus sp. CPCC 101409]MDO3409407.1 hypothetical protein [Saccharibacillus sp. CPCC 101409]